MIEIYDDGSVEKKYIIDYVIIIDDDHYFQKTFCTSSPGDDTKTFSGSMFL